MNEPLHDDERAWLIEELTRTNEALRDEIRQRSLAEEAMRAEKERLVSLLDCLPVMLYGLDAQGRVCLWNREIERILGYSRQEMIGKTRPEYFVSFYPDPKVRARVLAEVVPGLYRDLETTITTAGGGTRTCAWTNLSGHIQIPGLSVWGIGFDVTDKKRTEEALRRAKEAAESASRAKDEFLANVSHEIRTPMNAILGMTELALDTPLTAEQREYLAIVKSSADALLKVINDLLDFAKIEAGKLELDVADFSLRHVLGETLRALALRAHKKGLELACRVQPEVPDALIGDAGRLRQILLNLIGNAIKFTEAGEVVLRVETVGDEPSEHAVLTPHPSSLIPHPSSLIPHPSSLIPHPSSLVAHLRFSVSDTGIGIPRPKQEKIFQPFEQADNSTMRRYEGTGLGLSIAARLVALMGGQITVESDPGRGSTFRFTAGFGSQSHPQSGLPERPLVDLRGLRVLVVDDNATNRQILEEWLRGWDTEPVGVADGFKALDALWSAAAIGRPFALVLLDARMPGTDGLAVAESILRNPVLSTSPIILLTSEDLRGQIARYRELGIAACAMKPVRQEELIEIICRVLSPPSSADVAADGLELMPAAVSTAATTARSARRLRILVAEDNPFNQQLVGHLLRRKGHAVRVASDGGDALAALEQDRFDLMLLDVHMPGKDGFQVIETLRQREQGTGEHLPVIALTARAMRSDRERCLQAGMDDYLAKPIAAAELFRAMDRVLRRDEGKGMKDEGNGMRDEARTEDPTLSSLIPHPSSLLDPATLLAACGDDPTLLNELIQVFQADTPGALARLRDAVAERDRSQLRERAHELRGMLSTFSALAAAEAARLETMGAGGPIDDAASTLDGLIEIVERLAPQLEELSIEQLRHRAASGGSV
jgi:PAS domain S-box-containing protein